MNKVTFSEERRGYNKEEVEKYIAILQKGVADIDEELKEKEEECEGIYNRLEEANTKIKALNKQVVDSQLEVGNFNNLLEDQRREKELLKKQLKAEIVKYYIYMGSNRPKVLGKGVLISNGEVGNHKM